MTTSPPWLQMPAHVPEDARTYWVCQYRWFSVAFQAQWADGSKEWNLPAPFEAKIPWYVAPWFRDLSP